MAQQPQADTRQSLETPDAGRDVAARDRLDEKLDQALEATFPASDPFALSVGQEPGRRAGEAFADVDEDPNSRATYASPPCFMHELDPAYLGFAPDPADRTAGGERDGPDETGRG